MKPTGGRARFVVIAVIALAITALMATALVSIIDHGGGNVNIQEHRRFNQADHDSICRYLRDLARAQGNPVHPCGSESRP